MIDLRSDTVTRPSPAMREAMARAAVGDDQYGEDPSVNALEERVAALLGKDAAMFVPSGTMANQIALKVLTAPGDEVIVGGEAHVLWHETGAAAAMAGVQIHPVGVSGLFSADDLREAFKPRGHIVFPPTGLVVVENTHNRGGGLIFPPAVADAVCAAAEELGLATYLDGARLFNAAVALDVEVRTLARPFRMASVSLSKGLGCPVGSVLTGSSRDISKARRFRRMFGGAMRQAGLLAAAGLFALDHHIADLAADHDNARMLAERLSGATRIDLDPALVQTNIVMLRLAGNAMTAASLAEEARRRGVLVSVFGPKLVRLTTHRDVTRDECECAASIIRDLIV